MIPFDLSVSLIRKLLFFFFSLSMLSLVSCVSNKRIPYFQNISDSTNISHKVQEAVYTAPIIQPDDILSITIQTIDPQTSSVLNQYTLPTPAVGASSASPTGSQVITGFLVDKDGIVDLPMIGKLNLSGMSTFQARDLIREKISVYIKDPTVSVRFANFKITVLGEVAKPGTYTIPSEKVSVLDVLGLAGDLTIFGKRYNILLVRESGNSKELVRLDLGTSDLLKSPYFYLKQNDILYVEPTKAKVAALNIARTQTIALIGSALALLFVIATRANY